MSDLPALLGAYRFEEMERPLTLAGPEGFEHYLERLAALHGDWILEPSRPLTLVTVGEGREWRSDDGRLRLEAVSTPHTDESVAYRVEVAARPASSPGHASDGDDSDADDGSGRDGSGRRGPSVPGGLRGGRPPLSIGYTGDTGPSSEVATFLEGCAVLVAECALDDPPAIDTHLSPGSVADLAAAAEPTLLVVSHVYPPRRPEEAVRAIRTRYDGRVVAAADGLRASIAGERVTVDLPEDGPYTSGPANPEVR